MLYFLGYLAAHHNNITYGCALSIQNTYFSIARLLFTISLTASVLEDVL